MNGNPGPKAGLASLYVSAIADTDRQGLDLVHRSGPAWPESFIGNRATLYSKIPPALTAEPPSSNPPQMIILFPVQTAE